MKPNEGIKEVFTKSATLKYLKSLKHPSTRLSLGENWKYFEDRLKRSIVEHKLKFPEWLK